MMKMIPMLKLAKKNGALALSTMVARLIWPSLLPFRSITQQHQRTSTQHFS